MNITDRTIVFRLGENNNFDNLNITSDIKLFIADLRGVTPVVAKTVKEKFITFGHSISKMKGSFVIVCEFSFSDDLIIVPTLQEAYDYIEMEEIERQLEL